MGNQRAWDAITTPHKNERQLTIVMVAECCLRRFPYRTKSHAEDCAYILMVLAFWGWFQDDQHTDLGRRAYGQVVADSMSAWNLLLGKDLPDHGKTDKRPYIAYLGKPKKNDQSES